MDVPRKSSGLDGSNGQTGNRISGRVTHRGEKLLNQALSFLVHHRQAVLLAVIVLVFLLFVVEQLLIIRLGENIHIVFDGIIFILFVPSGTWLLLALFQRAERELEQAAGDIVRQNAFSRQLGEARTWEELVGRIVEFPRSIAPGAQVTLYVSPSGAAQLVPEAFCDRAGHVTLKPSLAGSPDTPPVGSLPQLLLQNGSLDHANDALEPGAASLPPNRYDLPVTRNDQLIGVLKLEYPAGSAPSQDEIRALKSAAPLIALALEGALLQSLAAEQAATSKAERQAIAQTLHDSLAQNIGYLRLKLDQLTGENAIREIGVVLQELERMRATADEAYQQVRNTLDALDAARSEDLMAMVTRQAEVLSERAGFALRTILTGAAFAFPPSTRQQILYIAREALHNVEKHARCRQVLLRYTWLETGLILKISDDGVGFNPLAVRSEGHYGLWIMQQRAQEIGGTLRIGPADERGTEITLWVPRPAYAGPTASDAVKSASSLPAPEAPERAA